MADRIAIHQGHEAKYTDRDAGPDRPQQHVTLVADRLLDWQRPATFHYKTDQNSSGRTFQYGLIAEEVAQVYPGLIAHSADGQVETVMYQFLPPMLLNEMQKQQRTIEKQTTHIAELERDRQLQTDAIATQAGRIAELEHQRGIHTAEIAGLKLAVAKIAELERQTAHLARLLGEERTDAVTARLVLE